MLELRGLTKVFGKGSDQVVAVDGLDLHVQKGEFVVLIGPSGCGKTTTLKMINRLVEPTAGDVILNGKSTQQVNHVQLRRNIGYVIQSIGLLPHLTIAANVGIVPKLKKWNKQKRAARIKELLRLVNLDPAVYAERYPSELSGGEQQRIGVLRALAVEPDLILMDEPFGALDPITRDQLQGEIKELQQSLKKTIVFVTHDMDEALKLADTIVLMKDGKIVQEATPQEMMARPANEFVREFVGKERLVPQANSRPLSEVMVPNPVVVQAAAGPAQALQVLQKENADIAVVVDEGQQVVGLLSARSLQGALGDEKAQVKDVVATGDATIGNKATIRDAASVLTAGTPVLCVVDEENKPVGLVNRRSLLRGLLNIWDQNGKAL